MNVRWWRVPVQPNLTWRPLSVLATTNMTPGLNPQTRTLWLWSVSKVARCTILLCLPLLDARVKLASFCPISTGIKSSKPKARAIFLSNVRWAILEWCFGLDYIFYFYLSCWFCVCVGKPIYLTLCVCVCVSECVCVCEREREHDLVNTVTNYFGWPQFFWSKAGLVTLEVRYD